MCKKMSEMKKNCTTESSGIGSILITDQSPCFEKNISAKCALCSGEVEGQARKYTGIKIDKKCEDKKGNALDTFGSFSKLKSD